MSMLDHIDYLDKKWDNNGGGRNGKNKRYHTKIN